MKMVIKTHLPNLFLKHQHLISPILIVHSKLRIVLEEGGNSVNMKILRMH